MSRASQLTGMLGSSALRSCLGAHDRHVPCPVLPYPAVAGDLQAACTVMLQPMVGPGLPRPPSSLFDLDDIDSTQFCAAVCSSPAVQLPISKPTEQLQQQQQERTSAPSASPFKQAVAAGEAVGGRTPSHNNPFDRTNSGVSLEQFEPSQLSALLNGPMPRLLDACKPANAFEQQVGTRVALWGGCVGKALNAGAVHAVFVLPVGSNRVALG